MEIYNFKIGRLKTGTPPRLDSRTINFENLEKQFADDDPYFFSFLTKTNSNKQVSCSMTYTNEKVHKIIKRIYLGVQCTLVVSKGLVQDIVLQ